MDEHRELIRDQFTRQAAPFSAAPGIRDEEALRLLVSATGAGARDTVLDVACGPGLVVCAFARVARHATGLDLTPAMLERAAALASEKGARNVSWEVGDVGSLPHRAGAYSIVVSRYSFHHLLEPAAALREMRRVSAPGGRIAVVDVMASSDPRAAAAYNRMEKIRDPSHVRAMTLAELEELFPSAGLPRPRAEFYRMECELEAVLSASFPSPGGADEIRKMFAGSLTGDGLGVGAHRRGDQIHFAYPIAVLAAPAG